MVKKSYEILPETKKPSNEYKVVIRKPVQKSSNTILFDFIDPQHAILSTGSTLRFVGLIYELALPITD